MGGVLSKGTTETTGDALNYNLLDHLLKLLLALVLLVGVVVLDEVLDYLFLCLGAEATILAEECWQLVVFDWFLLLLLLFLLLPPPEC